MCKIRGSHRSVAEDPCLLGCDAPSPGASFLHNVRGNSKVDTVHISEYWNPFDITLEGSVTSDCFRNDFVEESLCMGLESSVTMYFQKTSLSQMLYLSDNLAYFPYQVQDEPLFIIHHIDIMISVSGTNLVQSFREVSIS